MVAPNRGLGRRAPGAPRWSGRSVGLTILTGACILAASYLIDESPSGIAPPERRSRDLAPPAGPAASRAAPSGAPAGAPPAVLGPPLALAPGAKRLSPVEIAPSLERPTAAAPEPGAGFSPGRPMLTVGGRVIDADGRAVAGAIVRLGERQTRTDSQGEFSLPRASAELWIEHPGYFSRSLSLDDQRRLTALARGGAENGRLLAVLFRGARIRGRVLDAAGRPLAAASVRFSPAASAQPEGRLESRSNEEGDYESPLLSPDPHHVHIGHPDAQSCSGLVRLSPRELEARFDASLEPGARVLVRVRDREGRGLPDARLWLLTEAPPGGGRESRFLGLSGDQGELECRAAPGRQPRVRAQLPGYRESEAVWSGSEVELRLEPAPQLLGLASDRGSGLPAEILEVTLEMETAEGWGRAADRGVLFHTLDRGRFRVGLPPFAGAYRVRVRGAGQLTGASPPFSWSGAGPNPAPVEVALEPSGVLKGFVHFEDRPLKEVLVEIYPAEAAPLALHYGVEVPSPPPPAASVVSDEAGEFVFTELAPGMVHVRAHRPGFAEVFTAPMAIPAPAPVTLALRPGARLSGEVRFDAGQPEAGVPLILIQSDRPFPRFARSDGAGRYLFEHLPDGQYLLLAGDALAEDRAPVQRWSPSAASAADRFRDAESHALRIAGGEDLTFHLRLSDARWGGIAGRLRADGEPLAGLELRLIAAPGAGGGTGPAETHECLLRTDADGVFRLHGLAPGAYRLVSSYPPIGQDLTVQAGQRATLELDLVTQPLELLPADARSREALAGGRFAWELRLEPNGVEAGGRSGAAVAPAAEGAVSLGRFFRGRYKLRLRAPGFLPLEQVFELAEAPLRLPVELRPGMAVRVRLPGLAAAGASGGEAQPFRGEATMVLLREGVEVYRAAIELNASGEILIPELGPGAYQMTIRAPQGAAVSRFRVEAAAAGLGRPAALEVEAR